MGWEARVSGSWGVERFMGAEAGDMGGRGWGEAGEMKAKQWQAKEMGEWRSGGGGNMGGRRSLGRQVGKWEARRGLGRDWGSRLHCLLSKKFLWEELELVREEVTFIYQKLRECLEPTAPRRGCPFVPWPP